MLALRARLWADLGGYLLTTTPIPPHTAATLITGCYDIDTADVAVDRRPHPQGADGPLSRSRPARCHLHARGARRRGARDRRGSIASRCGARNLVRRFPHPTPTGLEYDSGDFERCLDLALELDRDGDGDRAGDRDRTGRPRRHDAAVTVTGTGSRSTWSAPGAPGRAPRSSCARAGASPSRPAPAPTAKATTSPSPRSPPTASAWAWTPSSCASATAPRRPPGWGRSAAARWRWRGRRSPWPPTSSWSALSR